MAKRRNTSVFTASRTNANNAAATSMPAMMVAGSGAIRIPSRARTEISVRSTTEETTSHFPGAELQHSRASSKQPRLQQQVRSIRRLNFDASAVGWILNDAQIDAKARWLPIALQRVEATAACRLLAVAAALRGDGRGSPLPLGLEEELDQLEAEIRMHAGFRSNESQDRDDGLFDRLLIAVDRLRGSFQALEAVLFD
jgi:hypothetical protein